ARGQAADLQQRADGALAGQDLERAVALLLEAEAAWREAERGALQQASVAAAAAERERRAALERLRQAAERQAATTGTARGEAERIAAERLATSIFAGARRAEDEGRAALARREWGLAQERLHAAEAAYREAAQAARREAERLAALERERREAERALEEAARRPAVAVAAGAEGSVAARRGAAWVRDGEAALAAGKPAPAAALFRDAQEAYRQAAAEARALAAEPVRITISAPADQAQVEQETLTVSGRIAGSRGVRGVLVTVNGKEVARRDEPAPAPSVPLDVAVRLREGQNTVVVTVTDAEGKLSQEVRSVHFERPTPLSVAVRYPAEGATLPHPSSVLAAAVTSGRGVERVTVKLNGRDVHEQVERRPPRSLAVAVPLTLEPGANAIVFTVTEAGGATRSETRTVTFKPPAGAGEASAGSPAPAAAPPERWAVVIGVGRYDNPQIARLRFAVEDAEAVARTLREVAGFKPENVVLLTDRTDRKPTLRNLKWALGTFLARSAGKGDTVVIFFAGHGAPEVDVSGKERDGLAKYLVPVDAEPDDLYATGLPMEEFETIFNRIEAERVVVFLDACYSGSAGGRTFSSRRTRALGVDDAFLERLARAKGRAIVTASRAAEVAVELSEIGHGLFTYYLVDGLRGGADMDRDGIVTLQEVYQHLEQQVTRHSRRVGASQHPVMKGELEGLLPLVRLRR
ncbi:MAG TPA: caspase family protein, partial [Candidatus Deferrimicrobiaceae bacterium]|nr:caspase family protein [Candidatus Deferrimicrobiaceae bacterium]